MRRFSGIIQAGTLYSRVQCNLKWESEAEEEVRVKSCEKDLTAIVAVKTEEEP